MQKIINGDLNLHLFSRWKRNEDWTYLGEAHVLSYEDNVVVADPKGNETFCIEYQLTCKGTEEDLKQEDIKSGVLTLKTDSPKSKTKKKTKRSFKGRGQTDYLLKSKKDKKLGELGEELVLDYEKKRLIDAGNKNFADAIEHVSKTQGDGTGYDIKSFNLDGTERYIEVKTTKQGIDTEFFMTPNEIAFSELKYQSYFLYIIIGVTKDFFIYKINNIEYTLEHFIWCIVFYFIICRRCCIINCWRFHSNNKLFTAIRKFLFI